MFMEDPMCSRQLRGLSLLSTIMIMALISVELTDVIPDQ